MEVDAERRAEIVDRVARAIEDLHVDPTVAADVATALRGRLDDGAYDEAATGTELASRLTRDLRAASGDDLLGVVFRRPPRDDPRETDPPPGPDAGGGGAHVNFGFERAERLVGNVGHLVVRGFHPAEVPEAAAAATAAMTFLAHTDALIVDLRENTGGAPTMATFLASFLFEQSVHLNTIAGRPGTPGTQSWTYAHVPGPRHAGPVYVLTSRRTFGAAEGFAYHLRARERAYVVGERTLGSGRLGGVSRIDPEFDVWVTTGRSVNPVTGTTWAGTGVVPDVEVPADQALGAAHAAARGQRAAPHGGA